MEAIKYFQNTHYSDSFPNYITKQSFESKFLEIVGKEVQSSKRLNPVLKKQCQSFKDLTKLSAKIIIENDSF